MVDLRVNTLWLFCVMAVVWSLAASWCTLTTFTS